MQISWMVRMAVLAACASGLPVAQGQVVAPAAKTAQAPSGYVLGPDDQISVRVVDAEEISDKPIRIGMDGYIRLPMAGRVLAGGLSVEQLEAAIVAGLKQYIRRPEVSVNVVEFRSQPVSVIGCVKAPGIHQLQGRRTLVEILALAGGLTDEAGARVKVTRRLEWGRIPLKNATDDSTGQYSVAEVKLKAIVRASSPEQDILIRPHDVISVPRAEMVYVTGQVVKSGGFVLNERETISVLQALALAGGMDRSASPQNARVLRVDQGASTRTEIAVNLKQILANKQEDIGLQPDDILFIPTSAPKKAALRAIEAVIQTGTGLVIWRR